jgi:transposase-like protein
VVQVKRSDGHRHPRFLWRCHGCGRQFTVRIGTILEDSRIPLRHWCYAFWAACAGKKGVSAMQIQRQTGLSYKSALFLMHRIRYAMTPNPAPQPKLTGTIEVDETWVGGKARKKSFQVREAARKMGIDRLPRPVENKVPVLAMVQRNGQVRASVVPNVTAQNVLPILKAGIDPSARIMTDEGRHYMRVGAPFASHETVNHSAYEYARGDVHINTAESFFSRLKRQLYGTHHAVSKRHLHRYVSEVVFKHNTRHLEDGERTVAAIQGGEGKHLRFRYKTSRFLNENRRRRDGGGDQVTEGADTMR